MSRLLPRYRRRGSACMTSSCNPWCTRRRLSLMKNCSVLSNLPVIVTHVSAHTTKRARERKRADLQEDVPDKFNVIVIQNMPDQVLVHTMHLHVSSITSLGNMPELLHVCVCVQIVGMDYLSGCKGMRIVVHTCLLFVFFLTVHVCLLRAIQAVCSCTRACCQTQAEAVVDGF